MSDSDNSLVTGKITPGTIIVNAQCIIKAIVKDWKTTTANRSCKTCNVLNAPNGLNCLLNKMTIHAGNHCMSLNTTTCIHEQPDNIIKLVTGHIP